MDKITHEVRLKNWKKIVEECNNRSNGTTVKEWLVANGIKGKDILLLDQKSLVVFKLFTVISIDEQKQDEIRCYNKMKDIIAI